MLKNYNIGGIPAYIPLAHLLLHHYLVYLRMFMWWIVSEVSVSSVVSSLHTLLNVIRLPGSTITRRSHCNAALPPFHPSHAPPHGDHTIQNMKRIINPRSPSSRPVHPSAMAHPCLIYAG